MIPEAMTIDVKAEAEAMVGYLATGNPCASVHLARLIESDHQGALQPFAEALAARVRDHLDRWAELGEIDLNVALEDELYRLMKTAAIDWDGFPCNGRPGEEA